MLSRSDKLKRKKINKFLSFIVICVTLSILILPAFTLEKKDDDTNDNNGPTTVENINERGGVETSEDSTLDSVTNNNNEDSSSEEDVMLLAEGTATTTTGFDLNNNKDKVDSIEFSYKDDNGEWQDVVDDATKIPADKELKLTVNFKNIAIQALLNDFDGTIKYAIPEVLRCPNGNGIINNNENKQVGTTEVIDSVIYLKYDKTHLQELLNENKGQLETGSFEVLGSANLSQLPDDGRYTISANKDYKFYFGDEPKAEYAKLNISKSQESKTVFINNENYLKYTITVTAGEDGCPNAVVVDTIKTNSNLVTFVGIDNNETTLSTSAVDQNPYETIEEGKAPSKIYKGRIPTDNTIPSAGASDIVEPGALVWNIGEMKGNETRALTYYVKFKDSTDLNKNKVIKNHADIYSVGTNAYKRSESETSFTPKISYDASSMTKKRDGDVVRNNDGSYTIKYKIYFRLYGDTTYTLKNFELWDYLDYPDQFKTETALLDYIDFNQSSVKLYKGKECENPDTEITSDKFVVTWLDGDNNVSSKPTRFKICGSDGNPFTLGANEYYYATYSLNVKPEALASKQANIVNIKNRFTVAASNANNTGNYLNHIDKVFDDENVGQYTWNDKNYNDATAGTITMDGDKYTLNNSDGKIENTSDVIADNTTSSFDVPEGCFEYTIKTNYTFDDWEATDILMKDEFSPKNLSYVGYMRIDAYEYKDKADGTKDYVSVGTKWINIDGLHSFSLKPSALGWNNKKLAYTITYYAKPFNANTFVHSVVNNSFTLTENVGRGGMTFPINVSSNKSVTVNGSYQMAVSKSAWNYAPPTISTWTNGALYWIIEIDTSVIRKDIIFLDELFVGTTVDKGKSYLHDDSLVGIYKGKISDGKAITDYKSLTELKNNETLEEITDKFTTNYTFDSGYSSNKYNKLFIQANDDVSIEDGKKVYIIVMSEPEKLPVNYRDTYTFSNKVSTSENDGAYVDKGSATKTLYDAPYILKELGQTFTYDGTTIKNTDGGTGSDKGVINKIITEALPSKGVFASWAIKLNYAGEMSGEYKVFEIIPDGMELAYIRIKWTGDEQYRQTKITSKTMSELIADGWAEKTTTAITDNDNTKVTTTYYVKGNQVQMKFGDFIAGRVRDKYALDVQVVCRVIDPDVLLDNKEKTYTNKAELETKNGTLIPVTSSATLKNNKNIDKTMIDKANSDGKIEFTIKLNPLGQDLSPVSSIKKIKLIDKMSESLTLDLSSIKIVETGTDQSVVYTPSLKPDNTLEIEVPSDKALTITYTTTVNAPPGKDVPISNNAYWEGYSSADGSSVNKTYKYTVSATSSAGNTLKFKLIKKDENNLSTSLEGAEFEMYECTRNSDGTISRNTKKWDPIITDANGTIIFGEGTSSTNHVVEYNTVYEIVETAAPAGYVKNEESIYIMFPTTTTDASVQAYVETCENDPRISKIYSAPYEIFVTNHKGEIEVEKKFKNAGGNDKNPIKGEYKFGLYTDLGVTKIQEKSIIYNQADTSSSATKTVKFVDLALDKTYYVYELNDSGNPIIDSTSIPIINGMEYITSYKTNNVDGSNGMTLTSTSSTGKVTVTNQVYTRQLPATGGNGINGYIKSGTILMLLTGVLLLKRRR